MSETKTKTITTTLAGDEQPDEIGEWYRDRQGANDYEIDEVDGNEVTVTLIWEHDSRVENATLPDGVDPVEVTFSEEHPDVLAHANRRPFDPRSGRWYKSDPWGANITSSEVAAGVEVDCAYADCDGRRDIEIRGGINDRCPECGGGKMGRVQFTSGGKRRRSRRSSISSRTDKLHDDFAKEMNDLTDRGVSTVAAMDYLMCSVGEIPYEEWAEARGVNHRSVKRNIKRVAETLGEKVTYKTRG